jgi:hypothetical protein
MSSGPQKFVKKSTVRRNANVAVWAKVEASARQRLQNLHRHWRWQLGEISANPLFVRLANPGDLLKAHWVGPAGLRAKPAYSEGCR